MCGTINLLVTPCSSMDGMTLMRTARCKVDWQLPSMSYQPRKPYVPLINCQLFDHNEGCVELSATPPGPAVPLAPNAAAAAVTRPPLASVDAPGMLKRLATDTPHSPPESLPAPATRLGTHYGVKYEGDHEDPNS